MAPNVASSPCATLERVEPLGGSPRLRTCQHRVLVVDDEEFIRCLLIETLEGAGYEVSVAATARTALHLLRFGAPEVVIADILLPDRSGLDLVGDIQSQYPAVKVLAISGGVKSDPTPYLLGAKLRGASWTLSKPFEPEAVLAAVRELLGG